MIMSEKDRRLIDYNPAEPSLEMLSQLQASLFAGLILTNQELIRRWRTIGDLGKDLGGDSVPDAGTLLEGADRLEVLTRLLQAELNRIVRDRGKRRRSHETHAHSEAYEWQASDSETLGLSPTTPEHQSA